MAFWISAFSAFTLFALNEIANPRFSFLGKILWKGDRSAVALTFDDGPHPVYTPKALEILDRYQAKATFFVIGRHLEEHGSFVSAASRAGHLIGNHTYHHFHTMNFFSAKKIRQEILDCQAAVERWTGYRPRFYRQPAGFRNPRIFPILDELGMRMVGWQVRVFDTLRKDPGGIACRILKKARPGGVILLHDGAERSGDRDATLRALPEILKGLKDRGLEFFTLDKLFGMSKEIRTVPKVS